MPSFLNYVLNNPVFSPIRVAGLTAIQRILLRRNLTIVPADTLQQPEVRDLIAETRKATAMVLLDAEAYNIYAAARQTAKVPGIIAEVGVYRGGSARLICAVKGSRDLHLFDTFAGLPEAGEHDAKFQKGGFASSIDEVRNFLSPFPGVHFHQGLFPATAAGLEDLRFSFVHLDVDLYESTRAALEWFYPRMNRGSILISHDYDAEGVHLAFDQFFASRPECVIELARTQVAFVKL